MSAAASRHALRRLLPGPRTRAGPPESTGRRHRSVERLRDPAHARPRRAGGAPRGDPRAHARAHREGRRRVGGRTTPWGRRRLAYEIDHKAEGVYHLLTFSCEPADARRGRRACSRSPTASCGTWRPAGRGRIAAPRGAAPPRLQRPTEPAQTDQPDGPAEYAAGRPPTVSPPAKKERSRHGQHQSRRPRRQPDDETRSSGTRRAAPRSAAFASPSTRAGRTAPPASGRRSRTTSTSPSGATRARAARSTSRRAARSRSTAASSGVSGRRRTARSARRSRSSPTRVQFLGGRGDGGGAAPVRARRRVGGALRLHGDGRRRHPVLRRRKREQARRSARRARVGVRARAKARRGGATATSAGTRSRTSTTRTSTSCAGTSPSAARSALGGSRARAGGTRTRSRPR